mgnify:CR=1 FL=1
MKCICIIKITLTGQEVIENNIKDIPSVTTLLKAGNKPEDIVEMVLKDLEPKILDVCEVGFECNCSKERVSRAVVSVGKKELTDMIEEGKPIEVNCHFCNSHYTFSVEELKEMLKAAR